VVDRFFEENNTLKGWDGMYEIEPKPGTVAYKSIKVSKQARMIQPRQHAK
jgi:hypothetical protein